MLQQARFEAYRQAVRRVRWFHLVVAILSSLMLFHVFLENWSFQKAQLELIDYHRAIQNASVEKTQHQFDSLSQVYVNLLAVDKNGHHLRQQLQELSRHLFAMKYTDNTIRNHVIPAATIPLTDMQIPGNDFFPIVASLTAIFCIGVWLNLRSMQAAAQEMIQEAPPGEKREWADIARLYFTFTSSQKASLNFLAVAVQHTSIFLPLACIVLASSIDLIPLWGVLEDESLGGYWVGPKSAIVGRLLVLFLSFLVVLILSISSFHIGREINQMIKDHTAAPSTSPVQT